MNKPTFEQGTIARNMLDEIRAKPQGTREITLCQYIDMLENVPEEAVEINQDMTVKELREWCKELDLPIYGAKAELIERIETAVNA